MVAPERSATYLAATMTHESAWALVLANKNHSSVPGMMDVVNISEQMEGGNAPAYGSETPLRTLWLHPRRHVARNIEAFVCFLSFCPFRLSDQVPREATRLFGLQCLG